jgi:hypothetical protein
MAPEELMVYNTVLVPVQHLMVELWVDYSRAAMAHNILAVLLEPMAAYTLALQAAIRLMQQRLVYRWLVGLIVMAHSIPAAVVDLEACTQAVMQKGQNLPQFVVQQKRSGT